MVGANLGNLELLKFDGDLRSCCVEVAVEGTMTDAQNLGKSRLNSDS